MKRVFIIHGWGGNSSEGWLVWLKKELESRGFEVVVPDMPDTEIPTIENWVGHLSGLVGIPDKDTYFVGHSIGCLAIMRYLACLSSDAKVGGAIFVAGWFHLTDDTWDDDIYTQKAAAQWINTPIDFDKIKNCTDKLVLIASDNDPYVSISDSDLFKEKLVTKVIIMKGNGHISGEDGVNELPIALEELLRISNT